VCTYQSAREPLCMPKRQALQGPSPTSAPSHLSAHCCPHPQRVRPPHAPMHTLRGKGMRGLCVRRLGLRAACAHPIYIYDSPSGCKPQDPDPASRVRARTSVCRASLTFSSMSTAVRLVCSRFSISSMSSRMSPCARRTQAGALTPHRATRRAVVPCSTTLHVPSLQRARCSTSKCSGQACVPCRASSQISYRAVPARPATRQSTAAGPHMTHASAGSCMARMVLEHHVRAPQSGSCAPAAGPSCHPPLCHHFLHTAPSTPLTPRPPAHSPA